MSFPGWADICDWLTSNEPKLFFSIISLNLFDFTNVYRSYEDVQLKMKNQATTVNLS
jgi:hypothetical protein